MTNLLKNSVNIHGDIITPKTELIDTQELEDVLALLEDEDMIDFLKSKYNDYGQADYFYLMGEHPHMTIKEFVQMEYRQFNMSSLTPYEQEE